MNNTEPGRWALWLSFPLATLLAVASLGGLFLPFTYKEETPIHAAQYVGNDVGNLAVIVPALLIAAILARRGSVAARLVWIGTLIYLLYDFLGYALAAHFNSMFLAYCGVLGLSFYALAGNLTALPTGRSPPLRSAHSGEDHRYRAPADGRGHRVPLAVGNRSCSGCGPVPQAVHDFGLLTEAVAVLDLAFGAPACSHRGDSAAAAQTAGLCSRPGRSDIPHPQQPGTRVNGSDDCPARLRNRFRPMRNRPRNRDGQCVLLVLIFRTDKAASYPDPERFSVDDHTKGRT